MSAQFKKYLSDLYRQDPSKRAAARGNRFDAFAFGSTGSGEKTEDRHNKY
jgi:hypothetical protein